MFVIEYLRDFVIKRAAERVGLAASTGCSYMSEMDVQAAIAEQMERRIAETQIDVDWVLQKLGLMFDADLGDIFVEGTNDLRPVHEWPETWRKMVAAVKIDDRYDASHDRYYTVKDIKIMDRLKVLEMIGKHTDVRAFTERVEITTDQDLTDRLMAGRKRAHERNKQLREEEPEDETLPDFM